MSTSDIFAANIRRILEHRGLSVNAAAQDWRIPQKTLESAIQRKRTPSLDTADNIANRAGFELWQMLHVDFDPANPPVRAPITPDEKRFYDRLRDVLKDAPTKDGHPTATS